MLSRAKRLAGRSLGAANLAVIWLYCAEARLTARIPVLAGIPERRLLVLAPHAGDEAIGCGGTLAEAAARGGTVEIAVLTDGAEAVNPSLPLEEIARRCREEARTAASELSAAVHFLEAPDGALRDNPPTDRLREVILSARPEAIFLPFFLDSHPDHATSTPLLEQALSRIPRGRWPAVLYFYQVQSPLGLFNVDFFVNTAPRFSFKAALLKVYRSQTVDFSLLSLFDRLNARAAGIGGAAEGFVRLPPCRYFSLYRRWSEGGRAAISRPVERSRDMAFAYFSGWREKKRLARLRRAAYPPPAPFYLVLLRVGLRVALQRIRGHLMKRR